MTAPKPNIPVQQVFSAATKNVLTLQQSAPHLLDALVAFKAECCPSAHYEVYPSSARVSNKTTVLTLRRSRDEMELVVDRRLKSGAWKSQTYQGQKTILETLTSMRPT